MRNAMTRTFYAATVALICCAPGAFAVDMMLTGVNAGYVMGGVYTSPYSITVGGTPMLLICDDFLTNIPSIPYSWSAIQTDITQIGNGGNPAGTPKFTPMQFSQYATAAILANELLALPTYYSETAGELSYAIWGVFDQPLLSNNPTSGEGHLTAVQLEAAQTYLVKAVNEATGLACAQNSSGLQCALDGLNNSAVSAGINVSLIPDLMVYTPNPLGASQEFIGTPLSVGGGHSLSMSESSYPAILAVDLLALMSLIVVLRRRLVGILN